jgi:hypothetical protein
LRCSGLLCDRHGIRSGTCFTYKEQDFARKSSDLRRTVRGKRHVGTVRCCSSTRGKRCAGTVRGLQH